MMYVKARVKGEPETPPLFLSYRYQDTTEETIFNNSIAMVRERLERGLRLNVNEAMLVFCAYAVSTIRERKSRAQIEAHASSILKSDNVMIGVCETLHDIILDVAVDDLPQIHLTFKSPIAASQSSNSQFV